MPILDTDILYFLSGGAGNSDPNASLGGVKSATQIDLVTTLHNLFDKVAGDEASAGDVEYRCFYAQNNHGTLTWEDVRMWISVLTPSPDTHVAIALAAVGKNGTAELLPNESTAPTGGETFTTPVTKPTGLDFGNLAPGEYWAVYVRRTVTAAAAAYNNDGATLIAEGDTAA